MSQLKRTIHTLAFLLMSLHVSSASAQDFEQHKVKLLNQLESHLIKIDPDRRSKNVYGVVNGQVSIVATTTPPDFRNQRSIWKDLIEQQRAEIPAPELPDFRVGRPGVNVEKAEAEKARQEAEALRKKEQQRLEAKLKAGAEQVFRDYQNARADVRKSVVKALEEQRDTILKANTYEACNEAVGSVNSEVEQLDGKLFKTTQLFVADETTYWYQARLDLYQEQYDVPDAVLQKSKRALDELVGKIKETESREDLDALRGKQEGIMGQIEKGRAEAGHVTIRMGGSWEVEVPRWNWSRYMALQTQENLPEGVEPPEFIEEDGVFEFIDDASRLTWTGFMKADAETRLKEAGLETTLIETETSLIYTTWPKSEHRLLQQSMVQLDKLLGKVFRRPNGRGVFLGKLPVFCFSSRDEFLKFSTQAMDHKPWEMIGVQGYAAFNPWGVVRLVVYRPEKERIHPTERTEIPTIVDWATVTAHEMTHAWMARIQSNRRVPLWLEEGLAEFMAYRMTIRVGNRHGVNKWELDREYAQKRYFDDLRNTKEPLRSLFNASDSLEAEDYPIAMTLVGVLHDKDERRLYSFIKACKDGKPVWEAMQAHFRLSKDEFVDLWRAKISQ